MLKWTIGKEYLDRLKNTYKLCFISKSGKLVFENAAGEVEVRWKNGCYYNNGYNSFDIITEKPEIKSFKQMQVGEYGRIVSGERYIGGIVYKLPNLVVLLNNNVYLDELDSLDYKVKVEGVGKLTIEK